MITNTAIAAAILSLAMQEKACDSLKLNANPQEDFDGVPG